MAEYSQYQYLFDLVACLLKSGNKKAFTSLFVPETEMMQYRAKMVQFKTEMTQFRTVQGFRAKINQSVNRSSNNDNRPNNISETGGQSYAGGCRHNFP